MVYAFLISTVDPTEFGVLYKTVFDSELPPSPEEADENVVPPDADCEASRRKQAQTIRSLLDRVRQCYLLNLSVGSCSPLGPLVFASTQYGVSDDRRETGGIFTIPVTENGVPKTVVWHALENSLCFAIVFDHRENRLMASRVLKHLVSSIVERSETCSPKELLRDASLVSAAVDLFLPSGQIVFVHSHTVKRLNLRLKKIMKGVGE